MPGNAKETYEDNLKNTNNYLMYLFLGEAKELTRLFCLKTSNSTRSKLYVEFKLSTLCCFVYERERGLDCACAKAG